MASVTGSKTSGWRITFYVDREKQTFRFTGSKATMQTTLARVEDMVDAANAGRQHSAETTRWLGKVEQTMLDKLERTGLLMPEDRPRKIEKITLAELADRFTKTPIGGKGKESSRVRRNTAVKSIPKIMGADVRVDRVTEAQAKDFRESMLEDYSEASVSRAIGYAREMFRFAIANGWAKSNPFENVRTGSQVNRSNHRFIDDATIRKVIEAAPDDQWKLLIALGRWTGMRVPSEPMRLRWRDIDFARKRINVPSPKTEHLTGRESREIPLFPELVEPLKAVYGEGKPADERVFTRFREDVPNLTTPFRKIIKRAGVEPWPKAWQNLRKSRQTELINDHGMLAATHWVGNTTDIAMKHYGMVRDEDFDRAACPQNDLNPDFSGDISGDNPGTVAATQNDPSKNNNTQNSPEVSQDWGVMGASGIQWESLDDALNGQTRT